MSWTRNFSTAYQVVAALPGRTILLTLPVAASTALALATLAIDRGLSMQAHAAARCRGLDLVTVRGTARVIAGKTDTASSLTEEDVRALRASLRGVKTVLAVRREDSVPTSFGGRSGIYKVFAVTPIWAEVRNFGAEHGRFLDQTDLDTSARVCVIGQTVARELFVGQDPLGQEIVLNQVPFRIKGILVARGSSPAEGDRDARIVVPFTTFFDRLYRRLHLDQIVIQATDADPARLAQLGNDVAAILRQQHRIRDGQPDDFTVRTPETITEQSRGISRSIFLLMLGLAIVGALLAATMIGAVAGQAVRGRRVEIGIRRALGATPADILWQIWAEGLLVSLAGGAVGFVLGLAGAWGLAAWRHLAFGVDAVVLVVPLGLILLTSLAGLFPARRAAWLDPAEALRGAV